MAPTADPTPAPHAPEARIDRAAAGAAADLSPVRMGLLTKLNLLTVGLVFLTAVATGGFYLWQQWRDEAGGLAAHGRTIATFLAELAERGLESDDRAAIGAMLDSLPADGDVAYVAVLNATRTPIAERRFDDGLGAAGLPPPRFPAAAQAPAAITSYDLRLSGQRYIELVAPVHSTRATVAANDIGNSPAAAPPLLAAIGTAGLPVGYVRVGMSFERQQAQFRKLLVGGATLVALVVLLAVASTMLLTRRLVSPMRRLMRAARAVGAGKLDVYVPPTSADELGHLTHAFNRMTRRLARSQSEVESYQHTLEEKVAQRTHELELATAQAFKLAQHDILTGLPNRSLLNTRLKQIIAQAQRDGTYVACVFIDFDHFKRINDTLGHDAGDQLLQSVAQRLTKAVRETDTVARLGGDEFVLLLPGLDPAHATFETMTVLARVRESFLNPFRLSDQVPTLTCSIGVSMYPIDGGDPVTLIKQADTAMYASKDSGRNAYRFYTADMNARVQQRLQLETDMRRGIVGNEFFVVYQPQIDLRTGRAMGVEALVRWRDPVRGIVLPADFIPVAEESGMIHTLGARVLRDACRQVNQWHRNGMLLRLSVNLSVQQLQHDGWLAVVEDALATSGLPSQFLDLEITESIIITHPERAVDTLVKLKQRGVSITVDDFGTGYSSLSYLARLPIQSLKIDQRFVHGLEQNKSDETITQAIIALSHSLGLRVIAEGVETAAQFMHLKSLGCEEAQGFLISRPMEEPEFATWWAMQAAEARINGHQPDMWLTGH